MDEWMGGLIDWEQYLGFYFLNEERKKRTEEIVKKFSPGCLLLMSFLIPNGKVFNLCLWGDRLPFLAPQHKKQFATDISNKGLLFPMMQCSFVFASQIFFQTGMSLRIITKRGKKEIICLAYFCVIFHPFIAINHKTSIL